MQEYRNVEFPYQIIEAQQEVDTRWTLFFPDGLQSTLSDTDFVAKYELNV